MKKIELEKVFDQVQYPFLVKVPSKAGRGGDTLNLIEGIPEISQLASA
jgi:hypothetical protein